MVVCFAQGKEFAMGDAKEDMLGREEKLAAAAGCVLAGIVVFVEALPLVVLAWIIWQLAK